MEIAHADNISYLRQPARLDAIDRLLIAAVQRGLPMTARPYEQIAQQIGVDEATVIARLQQLLQAGLIKRFGVVVRHHELGYRANAMVVFDVDDAAVTQLGRCIGQLDYVTLCYRRPRVLPAWPYNLFCMIHGKDRQAVLQRVAELIEGCGLQQVPHAVLFSKRRFKQTGAVYRRSLEPGKAAEG
jgi:DNA-binding Lrp family transcriptional regulator